MRTVEQIAEWAARLTIADVPPDVIELCRAQRRSVLGAIAASAGDDASARVLGAIGRWASEGPAPLVGSDRSVRVDDALYAASAWSIALDFDDYVCFGHTGHSSVLVPVLSSAETRSTGPDQLAAQVIANEVGARLGGACLLGPLNGQLWSFLHAGASALAAGRLLALDAGQLAHALAIALTNAPRPTVPGFMAPDTKLLTAADPSVAGLRAARLAAAGVTGPLDVLDARNGFLDAFSYAPLRSMLGRLGEGWATRTLSVKRYPGCAYIDTTLDAFDHDDVRERCGSLGEVLGRVRRVTVRAGLLTCGMDAMSAPYRDDPTPVTVNFSIPLNVAIGLLAGSVGPQSVRAGWLHGNRTELLELASRVRVEHDWEATSRTAAAFGPLLPVPALVRDTGRRNLLTAVRRLRADHHSLAVRWGDLVDVIRIGREASSSVRRSAGRSGGQGRGHGQPGAGEAGTADAGVGEGDARFWSPVALDSFVMTFPAFVEIEWADGHVSAPEADSPLGGAGNEAMSPISAAREKFDANASALWGEAGAEAIEEAVASDADDLVERLHVAR